MSDWWVTDEWLMSDWWVTDEWLMSDHQLSEHDWWVTDEWSPIIGTWLMSDWWVITNYRNMTDEWLMIDDQLSEHDWWVMTGVPDIGWRRTHDPAICGPVPYHGPRRPGLQLLVKPKYEPENSLANCLWNTTCMIALSLHYWFPMAYERGHNTTWQIHHLWLRFILKMEIIMFYAIFLNSS